MRTASTRRTIVLAGIGIYAAVLAASWAVHLQTIKALVPAQLVRQVLAPEDMVYADSDVAPARGKRMPGVDLASEVQATAAKLTEGERVFDQRCAACHGTSGHGDGPAGLTLDPRPRNFTSLEGWKRGTRLSDIFTTVTVGLEGTAMSGFDYLPIDERFAVAHYVESLAKNHPADTAATLAALDERFHLSQGVTEPNVEPLAMAVQKLAAEAPSPVTSDQARLAAIAQQEPRGAAIFGRVVRPGSSDAATWWLTADLRWIDDPATLRAMVVRSCPANNFTTDAAMLTDEDWAALERYLALRVAPGAVRK
jgi:mono/diheme cytochrome c family protein